MQRAQKLLRKWGVTLKSKSDGLQSKGEHSKFDERHWQLNAVNAMIESTTNSYFGSEERWSSKRRGAFNDWQVAATAKCSERGDWWRNEELLLKQRVVIAELEKSKRVYVDKCFEQLNDWSSNNMIQEADGPTIKVSNYLNLEAHKVEPDALGLIGQCGDRDITLDGPVWWQLRFG